MLISKLKTSHYKEDIDHINKEQTNMFKNLQHYAIKWDAQKHFQLQ